MSVGTSVEQDYRYCEEMIKQHSKSFYYAFNQLPKEKANAIYAIYTYCRFADDSTDCEIDDSKRLKNIQKIEDRLDLFKENREIDHPLWRALRDVFDQYDMRIQPFYDQLKGQRMDASFVQPSSLADVEKYSNNVAGSVGRMLLPIIASNAHADLTKPASSLGIAMQLTNILRDVGEDYRDFTRIYLPADEMSKAPYTEFDLFNGTVNEAFISIWEKLAWRAEERYDDFFAYIDLFDHDSRLPVKLSANIYREILDVIREHQYDCLRKRRYVSTEKMQKIYQTLNA